ncbi:MAG: rRNA adenine N-6-methyltransferase family protein [Terriglobales bacterium]
MTIDDCRRFYADEIRYAANVRSLALLEAFARVPREKFLGPAPWEIGSSDARGLSAMSAVQMTYTRVDDPRHLYHNVVVVLDKAADINNGQPSALARWIDALDLKAGDRAYHLGCGAGYYTAIMAEVVGTDASVAAAEVNPDLAARATTYLSSYPNVTVHAGDGAAFDPGECDAMLINAGATHPLPVWLDRLSEGGRLVVPLTMATTPTLGIGVMTRIVRHGNGFSVEIVTPLAIYSCRSARDPEREPFLKGAMTSGALWTMKSVRRDAHEQFDTCVLHGADVCLSRLQV